MTTYTAIPGADIDTDSPITESLMTKLRDNPIAITEKAAGAPVLVNDYIVLAMMADNSVGQSEIVAGAVHTSELSTATASQTTTGNLRFTMTGGMYVFSPQYNAAGGVNYNGGSNTINLGTTSASYITSNEIFSSASATVGCQWRYMNTSPPYDLGDGEIPLFIFAGVDVNGDVINCSVSCDPVWVHNGPTNNYPDGFDKGGAYQIRPVLPTGHKSMPPAARVEALKDAVYVKAYISQAQKNADMDLIATPYTLDPETVAGNITPVMVDPVGPMVFDLFEMMRAGESVNELFHDGHIIIDNTKLNRKGPSGLGIHAARWK